MEKFLRKYARALQKQITPIRRLIQWHLLFGFICITRGLAIILPEALVYKLGEIMAGVWYRCSRKNREKADKNLKMAFPGWSPPERKRVAQKVFQNLGRSALELFRYYGGKYKLQGNIHIENLDRLKRALEMGRGVIVVSAHLGNWELLACAASALGFPMRVVASRIRDSRIDKLLYWSRLKSGVVIVFRDEPVVRVLRHLRNREILAILMDQDSRFDGVFVNHFNQPTYTARGPALLALASGAPIVPVFIVRNDSNSHRIFIEEPITANHAKNREQEIHRLTQHCIDIIEQYIRRFPDQWVWMHQRWKTTPEDFPQQEWQYKWRSPQ